jgi:hypothetical protein
LVFYLVGALLLLVGVPTVAFIPAAAGIPNVAVVPAAAAVTVAYLSSVPNHLINLKI